MNFRIKRLFVISISICTVLALLVTGCGTLLPAPTPELPSAQSTQPTPAQTTTETAPPPEQSGNKGVDLPPIEYPEKGHPKLASHLNRLILAEEQGEAEAFARPRNIKLVNGNVRVSIECVPGQVEEAAKAVSALGTVELIARFSNGIQAVVPITSLTALADEESIRFIGLPVPPDPAGGN